MANYTASALLGAQAKFKAEFQNPELRRKQNPALALALKNMTATIQGHQELRKKDDRPVKAYIKTRRAADNATSKAHNHTGSKADSKEVTLAWVKFVERFTAYKKAGQSNIYDYSEQLAHEITESAKNLHSRAGTAALAYLQANRSQLASPGTGGAGTWNGTNFALEVDAARAEFFFQHLQSFMRKQDYRGGLDVILDPTQFRNYNRVGAQGSGNAVNTAFQIQGINAYETTEDIDANYSNGVALAMPESSFAGLVWNDPLNRKGDGNYDEYNGGYGVFEDPLGTGINFDLHAYTQRADGSSQGGGVQDMQLEGELTLTVGWVLPPLSTANESVVWEIAQAS